MSPTTVPSLSEDEIDDLLHFARFGETQELIKSIEDLARSANASDYRIVLSAVDERSRNGALHMASANGHLDVLKHLIALSRTMSSESPTLLNAQNSAGNTPLHWASLNGHLETVKLLVGAGADPAAKNKAGHNALYEAQINEKDAVAEWLLTEANGLDEGAHQNISEETVIEEDTRECGIGKSFQQINLSGNP